MDFAQPFRLLCYIIQKCYLNKGCMFFKYLFPHKISRSCIK